MFHLCNIQFLTGLYDVIMCLPGGWWCRQAYVLKRCHHHRRLSMSDIELQVRLLSTSTYEHMSYEILELANRNQNAGHWGVVSPLTLILSPSSSSVLSLKSTPIVASGFLRKVPPQNLQVKHVFPTFESPMTIILKIKGCVDSYSWCEESSKDSF